MHQVIWQNLIKNIWNTTISIKHAKDKFMDSRESSISMTKKAFSLCISFMLMSVVAHAQLAMTDPAQQVQPKQPLISVNFVRTPLSKVLHAIAEKVNVGLSYK